MSGEPEPTLEQARREAISRLDRAGVENPRLDAELLLCHVTGRSRTSLIAHPDAPLLPDQAPVLRRLVERRAAREPLPYLLGRWEFFGLSFEVTDAVLIPRPETEILVEAVADRLPRDARVLDVGTGSGCIAIGLATRLPQSQVIALDVSKDAAEVAERNAAALGTSDRVEVRVGSFPEAARELRDLDAVVSNPPYIPSDVVDELAPELRRHEPRMALDGGADGLTVLRALAWNAGPLLRSGGLLAMEIMQGQAGQVEALLQSAGDWRGVERVPDLAGIGRIMLARKR